MDLHVSLRGSSGLSRQIYEQLREAILEGRLRAGEAIPPTRELAARLGVSRNTVTGAYERLIAEGFLAGRVGAGTFVHDGARRAPAPRRAAAGAALRPRPLWSEIEVPPERGALAPTYDFRVGLPDARLFPADEWRRLVARQLRGSTVRAAAYGDPAGHARLRAAIARHIGVARSVRASAEDVIVTNGTQQALDLIGRVLVEPGDRVAVEDPGYPLARLSFQAQGARLAFVRVDAEGVDVAALPNDARLLYVTPSHQFPLGMAMSLARRMALLAWAERHRVAVVEDDYDSEFRLDGRPLEPLHNLDHAGRVLYVGSFSKTLLPGLRLGYLVAPPSLRPALRAAKLVADWYSPEPLQLALAEFIDEGLLARHVRRVRREYQARYEKLADALRRRLGSSLELIPTAAGLHLGALFREEGVRARDVAREARGLGVAVNALSRFAATAPQREGLVLGYGAIPVASIDEGVKHLASALRAVERKRTSRRA